VYPSNPEKGLRSLKRHEAKHGNDFTVLDQSETAVMEKINAMTEPHRSKALRLHEIMKAAAPELKSRLWYGMPGFAKTASDPVLLFFRADDAYITFGMTEKVKFTKEEGVDHQLMPCAWFMTDLDEPTEKKITEIVQMAIR
jgi:hypothetical protein